MATKNHYDILGVEKTADAAALKSAYRRMAKVHHPDLNPGDTEAQARFQAVNAAYEILSDAYKRALYDRGLAGAAAQTSQKTYTQAQEQAHAASKPKPQRPAEPQPPYEPPAPVGSKVVQYAEYKHHLDALLSTKFNALQRAYLRARPWIRLDQDHIAGVTRRNYMNTSYGASQLRKHNLDGTTGVWMAGGYQYFSAETLHVFSSIDSRYRYPKSMRASFEECAAKAFNACNDYSGHMRAAASSPKPK